MIALVDCNNFYASCERLFRPDLRRTPIVVLSNNDGCIVARSDESKALGIPMGVPLFKVQDQIRQHGIQVFSSNYTLYGDISNRVMRTIEAYIPEVEVYSIDEAFVDLSRFAMVDVPKIAAEIRRRVWDCVGIPVSVGVGKTKTLAKMASRVAKKHLLPESQYGHDGVSVLMTPEHVEAALHAVDVGDVWGVGRASARKVLPQDVYSAWEFTQLDARWVRQHMTVTGWRTHQELLGRPSIPFNPAPPKPRTVMFSRSLGERLWSAHRIEERTLSFAQQLALKLRRKKVRAGTIGIAYTGGYSERGQHRKCTMPLPMSTNDTRDILRHIRNLMASLNVECLGFGVKRITIIAFDFEPEWAQQMSLFTEVPNTDIMELLDSINARFGRGTMTVGITPKQAKRLHGHQRAISPRYTTRWSELPVVDLTR
jgi:DNA polymerase V